MIKNIRRDYIVDIHKEFFEKLIQLDINI